MLSAFYDVYVVHMNSINVRPSSSSLSACALHKWRYFSDQSVIFCFYSVMHQLFVFLLLRPQRVLLGPYVPWVQVWETQHSTSLVAQFSPEDGSRTPVRNAAVFNSKIKRTKFGAVPNPSVTHFTNSLLHCRCTTYSLFEIRHFNTDTKST